MSGFPIGAVDGVVLATVFFSGITAMSRGFVRSVLAVVDWLAAIIGTVLLLPSAQPLARQYFEDELLADIAAVAVLFFGILIVFSFVSSAIASRVRESSVNVLDRSLGLVFGLVRGAIIICGAYLGMAMLYGGDDLPETIAGARLTPAVQALSRVFLEIVPNELFTESEKQKLLGDSRLRQIIDITTKAITDLEPEKGYKAEAVDAMERLIEKTQDDE